MRKMNGSSDERVTLRTIANQLGLTPSTISVVLNGRPAANAIPQHTKDRIRQTASQLNYRPNYFARSLSLKTSRTHTVAVLVADLGAKQTIQTLSSVQNILRQRGYLMFVSLCDGYASERYLGQLAQHGIECVITLGVRTEYFGALPTVELDRAATAQASALADARQLQASAEVAVLSLLEHVETGQRPRAAAKRTRGKSHPDFAGAVVPFPAQSEGAEAVGS